MAKIATGDYVMITKDGTFNGRVVKAGSRARVLSITKGSGSRAMRNKSYARVDLLGEAGNVVDRLDIPAWWLRPRSILDDFADIIDD